MSMTEQHAEVYCQNLESAGWWHIHTIQRSPFSDVFARQCVERGNSWRLDLPEDDSMIVSRLLSYTWYKMSNVTFALQYVTKDAREFPYMYILAAKYNMEEMKKEIICSHDGLGISPQRTLKGWLEFVTIVFQGLLKPDRRFQEYFKNALESFLKARSAYVQYNNTGFKALISKGGKLAADCFLVYHDGADREHQHICSWMMGDGDTEVEERRWDLHSSVPSNWEDGGSVNRISTPS
ncbi:MAG: hypothetical protein Q9215_001396 [Flavoplaca cf. flavocitrina]